MSERTPAGTDRQDRFLRLIRENEARLRRICRVYGGIWGMEEDLYQDILVQVWRSLDSFEGRAAPATWLYRVALNTALGHRRRARRHEPLGDGAAATPVPDRSSQPDERLEARERLEQLYAAIDRLEDADKALVTLYLDDRSYREMAEVLGITESHVGVKLHRIRARMGEWLKEDT